APCLCSLPTRRTHMRFRHFVPSHEDLTAISEATVRGDLDGALSIALDALRDQLADVAIELAVLVGPDHASHMLSAISVAVLNPNFIESIERISGEMQAQVEAAGGPMVLANEILTETMTA